MQKVVDVKLKNLGKAFVFGTNNLVFAIGDKVVIESVRGVEIGEVVKGEYETSASEKYPNIIRIASIDDLKKADTLSMKKSVVIDSTNELIAKYKLDMKIVDVEFTLDNSKAIISFVCEDRVDFRELVKDLASKIKQRVELRQIGIRDQAKIVGGLGICGKEVCCKQYLNDFDKVSIKMAKNQNLSLNPTKISGVCGRLMCCLSYENDTYQQVLKIMPKINSKVTTPDGVGRVIYNDLLKEMVTVKFESESESKIQAYKVTDLKFDKQQNGKQESSDD